MFENPPGGLGVRVRWVALQLDNNWKCSQPICTVVSATCNSHVLLHRQCLIVEVVHEVAAETVSRRRRYRTWQGAVNVEQCVSVQMRSDAVVEPSLGCEVEHAFERDDREQCGRRQARGSRCTRVCWSRYAPRVFHRDANCNLAPLRSFGRCAGDADVKRRQIIKQAHSKCCCAPTPRSRRRCIYLPDNQHTGPCNCS